MGKTEVKCLPCKNQCKVVSSAQIWDLDCHETHSDWDVGLKFESGAGCIVIFKRHYTIAVSNLSTRFSIVLKNCEQYSQIWVRGSALSLKIVNSILKFESPSFQKVPKFHCMTQIWVPDTCYIARIAAMWSTSMLSGTQIWDIQSNIGTTWKDGDSIWAYCSHFFTTKLNLVQENSVRIKVHNYDSIMQSYSYSVLCNVDSHLMTWWTQSLLSMIHLAYTSHTLR